MKIKNVRLLCIKSYLFILFFCCRVLCKVCYYQGRMILPLEPLFLLRVSFSGRGNIYSGVTNGKPTFWYYCD